MNLTRSFFLELCTSWPRRASERWFGLVERAGRYLLLGMVRTDFSFPPRICEVTIATIATIAAIKEYSSHLLVHQWICSAIHASQQPTSPIGFLSLKLPPPLCVGTTGKKAQEQDSDPLTNWGWQIGAICCLRSAAEASDIYEAGQTCLQSHKCLTAIHVRHWVVKSVFFICNVFVLVMSEPWFEATTWLDCTRDNISANSVGAYSESTLFRSSASNCFKNKVEQSSQPLFYWRG